MRSYKLERGKIKWESIKIGKNMDHMRWVFFLICDGLK